MAPSALDPSSFASPRPSWFAPKDLDAYLIWAARAPASKLVLVDRVTGELFLHVSQL